MKSLRYSFALLLSLFLLSSNLSYAAALPAGATNSGYDEETGFGGTPVGSSVAKTVPENPGRVRTGTWFCDSLRDGAYWLISGANNRTLGALGWTPLMGMETADEETVTAAESTLPTIKKPTEEVGCLTHLQNKWSSRQYAKWLMGTTAAVVVIGGVFYFLIPSDEIPEEAHTYAHGRGLQETTSSSLTAVGVAGVMIGNLGQDMWRWLAGILTRRNAPRELWDHASLWFRACSRGVNHDFETITPEALPHDIYAGVVRILGGLASLAETLAPNKTVPTMELAAEGREMFLHFHRPSTRTDDSGSASGTLARVIEIKKYDNPVVNFGLQINHLLGRKTYLIKQGEHRLDELLYNLVPDGEDEARNSMRSLLEAATNRNPTHLAIQSGRTTREVRFSSRITVPAERDFLFIHLLVPSTINMMGLKGDYLVPHLSFRIFNMLSTDPSSKGLVPVEGLRSLDSYSTKRDATYDGIIDSRPDVGSYRYDVSSLSGGVPVRRGLAAAGALGGSFLGASLPRGMAKDIRRRGVGKSTPPRALLEGEKAASAAGSDDDSVKSMALGQLGKSIGHAAYRSEAAAATGIGPRSMTGPQERRLRRRRIQTTTAETGARRPLAGAAHKHELGSPRSRRARSVSRARGRPSKEGASSSDESAKTVDGGWRRGNALDHDLKGRVMRRADTGPTPHVPYSDDKDSLARAEEMARLRRTVTGDGAAAAGSDGEEDKRVTAKRVAPAQRDLLRTMEQEEARAGAIAPPPLPAPPPVAGPAMPLGSPPVHEPSDGESTSPELRASHSAVEAVAGIASHQSSSSREEEEREEDAVHPTGGDKGDDHGETA